jgi:hypothetical protein
MSEKQNVINHLADAAFGLWGLRNEAVISQEDADAEDYLHYHDVIVTLLTDLVGTNQDEAVQEEDEASTESVHNEYEPVQESDFDDMTFAEKLGTWMETLEWDVSTLSESAGVAKETVKRILDGTTVKPHGTTVKKLETAMGVSFDG